MFQTKQYCVARHHLVWWFERTGARFVTRAHPNRSAAVCVCVCVAVKGVGCVCVCGVCVCVRCGVCVATGVGWGSQTSNRASRTSHRIPATVRRRQALHGSGVCAAGQQRVV